MNQNHYSRGSRTKLERSVTHGVDTDMPDETTILPIHIQSKRNHFGMIDAT